ncbi:TRAP transporter permease [Leucothrix arctica]|uniref:TRAP transporter permease DctM/Q n=1 Tax=Leucothrix arctica TaxID=1481894 RepID=A0A317CBL8_9GAMM|nr:TRAP transporter fused permease subunit [Leucothrix arctica]PWQ94713.1 TRAP transporter permease DctM/Q [Leucothrix arctica]
MSFSSERATKALIVIFAFSIGLFHLANVSGVFVLSTQSIRIYHLMMMLALLFLSKPSFPSFKDKVVDKWVSGFLTVASLGTGLYMLSRWQDIAMSGGETELLDAIVGVAILALVLEGARRAVGNILAIICLMFFIYPFVSPYLPGVLESRGYSLLRISEILTTTSQGLYGIPLGVSATYIILFSIYGAFLTQFGAGEFFFKIASRVTQNMRAAGAKTAVIFSTLLGMVSGSAAGNVAVTGTLTIPMMKREGYKGHQAGAIEAVVSTGGQLMPPVMGAAAFIMAEIIGTPYTNIMKAAIVPACLFFLSIFLVVHLQACKADLKPMEVDSDDRPMWKVLLSGGQYIIPFATLVIMIIQGYSPFKACFYSILILLACNVIWERKINKTFFIKSFNAITQGAKSVIPIAVACAAAGIIAGTLGITGLGSKISGIIISTSGGVPIFALLLTMVVAIILGMGLPTTAAYLILATVVAPALSQLGVDILTAHLFVFFYGCVSTITPPVALASYVAAGISGSSISKVSWTAFFYGITCYILPFMFFYGPGLLLQGSIPEILLAVSTAIIGVFAIASAVVGFYRYSLSIPVRVVIFGTGILLMLQGITTDLIGAAILAAFLLLQKNLTPKGQLSNDL